MKIAHKALLVSITSFLFVLSGCTAKDKSNNPSAKKSTPIHNNINNAEDIGKYFILEKRKISQSEFNDILKKTLATNNTQNAVRLEKYSSFAIQFNKGIKNFAFYDDALLFNLQNKVSLFNELTSYWGKINLHTPNAMHLRFVDKKIAEPTLIKDQKDLYSSFAESKNPNCGPASRLKIFANLNLTKTGRFK